MLRQFFVQMWFCVTFYKKYSVTGAELVQFLMFGEMILKYILIKAMWFASWTLFHDSTFLIVSSLTLLNYLCCILKHLSQFSLLTLKPATSNNHSAMALTWSVCCLVSQLAPPSDMQERVNLGLSAEKGQTVSLDWWSPCFPFLQKEGWTLGLVIFLLSHLWDGLPDEPGVWATEPPGKVRTCSAPSAAPSRSSGDWLTCSLRFRSSWVHLQHPFLLNWMALFLFYLLTWSRWHLWALVVPSACWTELVSSVTSVPGPLCLGSLGSPTVSLLEYGVCSLEFSLSFWVGPNGPQVYGIVSWITWHEISSYTTSGIIFRVFGYILQLPTILTENTLSEAVV